MTSPLPSRRLPRSRTAPPAGTGGGAARHGSIGGTWAARLSWPVAFAAFAVPLVLLLASLGLHRASAVQPLGLVVTDAYSGAPIPGAVATIGDRQVAASDQGIVDLQDAAAATGVLVSAPGHEAVTAEIDPARAKSWSVALRPNVLSGEVTDAKSGMPVAGASVAVQANDATYATGTTGDDGRFQLANVPAGATVSVSSETYGTASQPVGQTTVVDFKMVPTLVTGTVVNDAGAPIAGARVTAANGSAAATTGPDGAFRMVGGTDVAEVVVEAPGFDRLTMAVPENRTLAATIEPQRIKSLYAPGPAIADPDTRAELLRIADETEINAIVVDVKQDTIFYDTQVPFFKDLPGVVTPLYDPKAILEELHAHNLYVIARMVVFKDPVVAEARPDLDVIDETTGGPWRDDNGAAWVNAFKPELWQANAELAAELVHLGFDEVQYDYIRLPSDGNLKIADFGNDYSEASRRAAITGAVKAGADAVHAAGGRISVDLFPVVALYNNDQGIGQTLEDLTPLVDYVSLMIYPSHFATGNIPVDGPPNDFPAETVKYTLDRAHEIVPGSELKMRPWLQDFTYPMEGYSAYGPTQVREQIDAAEAEGVSGWILWNAATEFSVDALKPAG